MKYFNKALGVLCFLFLFQNSYTYAQYQQCSIPEFHSISNPIVSNGSEVIIYYNITRSNCQNENLNFEDVPGWLTIEDLYNRVKISFKENKTTSSRNTFVFVKTQSQIIGRMDILQNTQYKNWYLDSDGDGLGGHFEIPMVAIDDPYNGNGVNNNDDWCPETPGTLENMGCTELPENFNWIKATSYDILGNTLSSSKAYFDDLGKGTQSQTYDIKEGRTWATQTLYDSQGRAAFQTLSAPISEKKTQENFQFNPNFIKKTNNTNFTTSDFETSNLENPATVGAFENTLGWYYSDANRDEPYQDKTDRPYSRTIFSKLNPGSVKQTIGGNKIDGQWKQGYAFSMPAAQEMYYVFGYDYFEANPDIEDTYQGIETTIDDSNKQIVWLKTTKSVVEDVHGNEAVVFTDTDGKTLGAARAGIPENPTDEKQYEVLSLIGEQKYVDIHIPKGCENTTYFIGGSRNYKVYNLKTEIAYPTTPSNLPAGFYRVEYTGGKTFTKKSTLSYINKSNGRIYPVETDAVGVRYKVNYYEFSLNEYNKAGDLTTSLQPIGFNDACLDNVSANVSHNNNAKSTFSYNSLGQLLSTTSPDEGTTNFKYRKDGQIRFSQNSKQALANEFSYTNYDEFGRPVESGVNNTSNGGSPFHVLNHFLENNDFLGTRSEQQETIYDQGGYDFAGYGLYNALNSVKLTAFYKPTFLAGNVVATQNQNTTSWYSYDIYGRVQWIVQNIQELGTKTIDYEYDPVTSQVLKVIYQKHTPSELFVHKYTYNTAQELVKVQTSTNNTNFTTHADYEYYETGALKRVELAEGIQGIDYVYNLAGQLKSINHHDLDPTKDPGKDTTDLFGMTLDYYTGDYTRTNGFSLNTIGEDQYNGNIKGMSWKTQFGDAENPLQYTYQYNRNNWLTGANFRNENEESDRPTTTPKNVVLNTVITSSKTVTATNSITLEPGFETAIGISFSAEIVAEKDPFKTRDYKVYGITYDANGNIQTLNRNKNKENGSNRMDKLKYHYYEDGKPNQLRRVDNDVVDTFSDSNNIGGPIIEKNAYIYNSIGQLVKNKDENVKYTYNASGLVTEVKFNNKLKVKFSYNDKGFRVQKKSYTKKGKLKKTTHYVRDASGSVLAIYKNSVQKEMPIYGASRLGVYNKSSNTSVYQLTDHLGNVRAVFAKDDSSNTAALIHATDYYPFGMPMPNRQIVNGEPYRYGYQGQEKDLETGKEAFQLRLWDSRIGRWLTVDPKHEFHSPYLGMGNNPISKIDPDGGCVDCPENAETGATHTEGGYEFTMGEDGIWWNDDYFNDYGVSVGDSYLGDQLDPSTEGQNLFGLSYAGHNNPLTFNGDDSFAAKPKNLADFPPIGHDRTYINAGTKGLYGLLTDTRVIGADWKFVAEELGIAFNPSLSIIPLKTRIQAGALGVGLGLAAYPKTVITILFTPNGKGIVNIMVNHALYNHGVTNIPHKQ